MGKVMANTVQLIPMEKLIAHPDNPNRMSKSNFTKLVRNIERSGRYEPIVARPHPQQAGCYQIINGHHRCEALAKLGHKQVDAVVWDIDDEQVDILLATLNRLGGSDELSKKLKLLEMLNKNIAYEGLAKLLPFTRSQIERLTNLKRQTMPAPTSVFRQKVMGANPMVFFVNDVQERTIREALSLVEGTAVRGQGSGQGSRAERNAAALTKIAEHYIQGTKDSVKS